MAMRKAIKIKVYVMVLAWMVIFLHDAIPHNHDNSPDHNCHAVIHSVEPGSDLISSIPDQVEHITGLYLILTGGSHNHNPHFICHFSTSLYHDQLLEMNAVILTDNPLCFFSQKITATISPAVISPVIKSALRLSLLRGPPHNA